MAGERKRKRKNEQRAVQNKKVSDEERKVEGKIRKET